MVSGTSFTCVDIVSVEPDAGLDTFACGVEAQVHGRSVKANFYYELLDILFVMMLSAEVAIMGAHRSVLILVLAQGVLPHGLLQTIHVHPVNWVYIRCTLVASTEVVLN